MEINSYMYQRICIYVIDIENLTTLKTLKRGRRNCYCTQKEEGKKIKFSYIRLL